MEVRGGRRPVVDSESFRVIRELLKVSAEVSPSSSVICGLSNVTMYTSYNSPVAEGVAATNSGGCTCCVYSGRGLAGRYSRRSVSMSLLRSAILRVLGLRVGGMVGLRRVLSCVKAVPFRRLSMGDLRTEGRGGLRMIRGYGELGASLCRSVGSKVLAGRRCLRLRRTCLGGTGRKRRVVHRVRESVTLVLRRGSSGRL